MRSVLVCMCCFPYPHSKHDLSGKWWQSANFFQKSSNPYVARVSQGQIPEEPFQWDIPPCSYRYFATRALHNPSSSAPSCGVLPQICFVSEYQLEFTCQYPLSNEAMRDPQVCRYTFQGFGSQGFAPCFMFHPTAFSVHFDSRQAIFKKTFGSPTFLTSGASAGHEWVASVVAFTPTGGIAIKKPTNRSNARDLRDSLLVRRIRHRRTELTMHPFQLQRVVLEQPS